MSDSKVKVYQFRAHVGGFQPRFVGRPEDCGYHETDRGWRDELGNDGEFHEEDFDHVRHANVLLDAWSEDGKVRPGDEEPFLRWARQEIGVDHDTATRCLATALEREEE